MIEGDILLAFLPSGEHVIWAAVAAAAGVGAGRLLTWGVGGLLDSGTFAYEGSPVRAGGTPAVSRRGIEISMAAAALALWWWEVRSRGLGPFGSAADTAMVSRCIAHAVLGWLLAAAAWIDIRHRVIPDGITFPGVVLGLAIVWLVPEVLLPIGCDVPRSFAPPLLESDVLGWFGGLHTQTPHPSMRGWPNLPGLLVPAAIFLVWWFVCTAPFLVPAELAATGASTVRTPPWHRIEPRNVVLLTGLAGISLAWCVGGERFLGLQSGLVGLGVSAGLVWCIREGASRSLGREAMGLGDVTLMAMVGAWVGWQASVLTFFLAAFIGLAHGLVQLVRHRENELPYGPSLCLACAAVVVFWRPLWAWAGGPFSQPLELAMVIGVVVVLTAVTLFVWQRLRG